MTDKKYWVWLACALGAGAKTEEIFSAFKTPFDIYKATPTERIISGVFIKGQMDRFSDIPLKKAEEIISVCERNGWNIVTPDDKEYPAGLRRLRNMPIVLYVDGDISCLRGKVIIGVVGSRKPGVEGLSLTHNICTDISAARAVIVSGGALGIDSAAHESALYANGKTVCVLGCGLGTRYLTENEALRREISRNGAVVSEYPPNTPASKASFPIRNRIISGMSHAVLVVEAGIKSGSLITAKTAFEQNREVFAIHGNVLSSAYSGANKLISEGAKAVSCAKEILEPYSFMYPDRLDMSLIGTIEYSKEKERKEIPAGFDSDMEAVYKVVCNKPLHVDDIVALSGLGHTDAVTAIMQLELAGYIEQTESKKYILK